MLFTFSLLLLLLLLLLPPPLWLHPLASMGLTIQLLKLHESLNVR